VQQRIVAEYERLVAANDEVARLLRPGGAA